LAYENIFSYLITYIHNTKFAVADTGTICQLALHHCCKAHAKINRKMGNMTPCKRIPSKNITLKLCTCHYSLT